jgi:hypothetical protein
VPWISIAAQLWIAAPALPDASGPDVPPPPDTPAIVATTPAPWQWHAPPDCPDLADVRARIEALLGHAPTEDELALRGDIVAVAGGYRLDLRVRSRGPEDVRELHADRCSVLAESAALVAAVMLDPVEAGTTVERLRSDVAREDPSPEERILPRTDAGVATVRVVARTPAQERSPRGDASAWLRLRGGGEFGAIPGGTGGFDLALAFGGARVRGELLGAYWIGREVSRGGAQMRVHLGTVTPRVCVGFGARRLHADACAGLELGVMRASLTGGVRQPPWIAPQIEAGVRIDVAPRIAVVIAVQAAFAAVRPEFRLESSSDPDRVARVYRPSSVSVRALAGLEVRLGRIARRR